MNEQKEQTGNNGFLQVILALVVIAVFAVSVLVHGGQFRDSDETGMSAKPQETENSSADSEEEQLELDIPDDNGADVTSEMKSEGEGTTLLESRNFLAKDYDNSINAAAHAADDYGRSSSGKYYVEFIYDTDDNLVGVRCVIQDE